MEHFLMKKGMGERNGMGGYFPTWPSCYILFFIGTNLIRTLRPICLDWQIISFHGSKKL